GGFGRVDGGNWGVGGVGGRLCFGVCGKCAKSRAPIACLCKERNGELRTIKSQKSPPCRTKRDKDGAPAFSSWRLRNGVNGNQTNSPGPGSNYEGALRLMAGHRGGRANTGRLVRCAA